MRGGAVGGGAGEVNGVLIAALGGGILQVGADTLDSLMGGGNGSHGVDGLGEVGDLQGLDTGQQLCGPVVVVVGVVQLVGLVVAGNIEQSSQLIDDSINGVDGVADILCGGALLGTGDHQVSHGEGVAHVGVHVVGAGVGGGNPGTLDGQLMHGSVNGLGSGVDGVVNIAHGDVQGTGQHIVGPEVVGALLSSQNGGVLLIGQQNDNQILLGIDEGQGAGPALVTEGLVGGLSGPVGLTGQLALTPPAQAPLGIIQGLGLDELLDGGGGEVVVLAVAAGQHDGAQLGQVLGVGIHTGVAGDAVHGVVALLVVHGALADAVTHVVEVNDSSVVVAAQVVQVSTLVAVQLGGCTLVDGPAVLQGVVGDVVQAHGGPEDGVEVLVQTHAGDLLDDEAQQHVVGVGVGGLGAGLILQGRGHDHLVAILTALSVQSVGVGITAQRSGGQVEVVVVIHVVSLEAGLMHQNVLNGDAGLPLLGSLQILGIGGAVEVDKDGGLDELVITEDVHDLGVQIQLALLVQVLDGVVDGVHLGVGGQIVQGVGGHGDSVLRIDLSAVRIPAVDIAVGGILDHLAILDDGDLSAGEAVLDGGVHEVVDQVQGAGIHADILGLTLDDDGIADIDGDDLVLAHGGDIGNLNGVDAVHGDVSDVDLVGLAADHASSLDLHIVDKQTQRLNGGIQGDIDLALVTVTVPAAQAVDGQGVVGTVGECTVHLPVLIGQRNLGDTAVTGGGCIDCARGHDGEYHHDGQQQSKQLARCLFHCFCSLLIFMPPRRHRINRL